MPPIRRDTYNKAYYQLNKERFKENWKCYYAKNSVLINARVKGYKLKWRYGLTQSARDSLEKQQRSRCAICKLVKPLVVDHNHKTGYVRGLLCHDCNKGLGFLKDSLRNVFRAWLYLLRELLQ